MTTAFKVDVLGPIPLKKNSTVTLISDAHGPTNGCSRTGERFLKFWVDRDTWLPHIDILKMNLEKAVVSDLGELDYAGICEIHLQH